VKARRFQPAIVVIDRASGAVREHLTEAFFIFHTVNAFERDDATVLY
jgi:carotenoid cleavage dioxygenase-like enzyme